MKKKKIILASSSEYRKSIFSSLKLDFICISPNINETPLDNEKPEELAIRLSIEKAKKIAKNEKNSIIIGSDACACCEGRILGKPLSKEKAIIFLRYMSNKTVEFYTGICVINSSTNEIKTDISKYMIKIKKLNDKSILEYIDKYKPFNSSAAFRYEVAKEILIKEFIDNENDISGLIGLPLKKLIPILKYYSVLR